jgi:hypothetical protein
VEVEKGEECVLFQVSLYLSYKMIKICKCRDFCTIFVGGFRKKKEKCCGSLHFYSFTLLNRWGGDILKDQPIFRSRSRFGSLLAPQLWITLLFVCLLKFAWEGDVLMFRKS